jgi:cell wall-associated NlpC family hydrolase
MFKYCALIFTLIYLSGCTSLKPITPVTAPITADARVAEQPLIEPEIIPEEKPLAEKLLEKLLAQYQEWKGTRYRMGGLSKTGVDCSGFVLLAFRHQFGIELPRSTREQNTLGQDIKRDQLIIGDLVFFRTGRNNHVGIYLGEEQFLHASTRAGVKISKLSEPYWKRNYWKAKRLDFAVITKTEKSPSP